MTQIQMPFADAQAAFAFVTAQGRNVETTIYQQRYPTFDYAGVLPVVTEGNPWAIGTQFMNVDLAGEAKFLSGAANDMPFNQAVHGLNSHDFAMIGSGWEWNLEEINQASLYGINLSDTKARSASQSIERKLYDTAMVGSTEKNWTGFVNATGVTVVTAAASGTGSSTEWADKTPAQMLADLNDGLGEVSSTTNEVEYADTVAMPPSLYRLIATTYTGTEGNSETVLQRFRNANVYTAQSNQPITIKSVRALENAGADGGGRLVFYRNAVEVLRFHLPMPRLVLPTRQKSIMGFETGIIARTGGTEVRLPGAMLYVDGVSAP